MTIESTIKDMAKAARERPINSLRFHESKKCGLVIHRSRPGRRSRFHKGENQKDLARAEEMGLSSAMLDRLAIKDHHHLYG